MFTVEEITLLRAFDTSTRRTAILSLMNEISTNCRRNRK